MAKVTNDSTKAKSVGNPSFTGTAAPSTPVHQEAEAASPDTQKTPQELCIEEHTNAFYNVSSDVQQVQNEIDVYRESLKPFYDRELFRFKSGKITQPSFSSYMDGLIKELEEIVTNAVETKDDKCEAIITECMDRINQVHSTNPEIQATIVAQRKSNLATYENYSSFFRSGKFSEAMFRDGMIEYEQDLLNLMPEDERQSNETSEKANNVIADSILTTLKNTLSQSDLVKHIESCFNGQLRSSLMAKVKTSQPETSVEDTGVDAYRYSNREMPSVKSEKNSLVTKLNPLVNSTMTTDCYLPIEYSEGDEVPYFTSSRYFNTQADFIPLSLSVLTDGSNDKVDDDWVTLLLNDISETADDHLPQRLIDVLTPYTEPASNSPSRRHTFVEMWYSQSPSNTKEIYENTGQYIGSHANKVYKFASSEYVDLNDEVTSLTESQIAWLKSKSIQVNGERLTSAQALSKKLLQNNVVDSLSGADGKVIDLCCDVLIQRLYLTEDCLRFANNCVTEFQDTTSEKGRTATKEAKEYREVASKAFNKVADKLKEVFSKSPTTLNDLVDVFSYYLNTETYTGLVISLLQYETYIDSIASNHARLKALAAILPKDEVDAMYIAAGRAQVNKHVKLLADLYPVKNNPAHYAA